MSASNRLLKEIKEIEKEKEKGFMLRNSEKNLHEWSGYIKGPLGTPYQSKIFKLNCQTSNFYPINPPIIKFGTRIFHPNIRFYGGEICLDVLTHQWTPAWTLSYVLKAILVLLSNPEPISPLNCDAGNLVRLRDYRGYSSLIYMHNKFFLE